MILTLGLAVAVPASHAQSTPASPKPATLRVASAGGAFTQLHQKYAAALFTQRTGIKVEFIDANASDHLAKLIAAKGRDVPYDVVYLDKDVQEGAIDTGVLQKLDPAKIPNLKHIVGPALDKDGYGPELHVISIGIAYNAAKFKAAGIAPPTSWNDLWNPQLAGKVSVPELTHLAGRALLLQASRLEGGNEATPEKGIARIAKIKAHDYYNSTVQVENLFQSGEIWAAPMSSGRAWGVSTRYPDLQFVDPKEGGVAAPYTIDIVKGTKYPDAAAAYIDTVLAPLPQLGQATELFFSPTNDLIIPLVAKDPQIAPKLSDINKLIQPDWRLFMKHYDKAVALWNRQVAR
ncbi:hypothetical protein ASB57_04170 [Bordetella sp. N]|nr:hypothetical protein ASB57_04170 [Bordetella sp. N]